MKKLKQKLLLVTIITSASTIALSSCSGQVGNTNISTSYVFNMDNYQKPKATYRLINNDRAYELVSIEENYFGAFMVDLEYNDPNDVYGKLPVTSIAAGAFSDFYAVFYVVILANIVHIAPDVFSGWRAYQNIYFQITSELSKSFYRFDAGWDRDCEATFNWEINPDDFWYFME